MYGLRKRAANINVDRNHVKKHTKGEISFEKQGTRPTGSDSPEFQEFWLPIQQLRGTVSITSKNSLRFDKIRIGLEGTSPVFIQRTSFPDSRVNVQSPLEEGHDVFFGATHKEAEPIFSIVLKCPGHFYGWTVVPDRVDESLQFLGRSVLDALKQRAQNEL
ncbi:hypothetical protein H2202_011208 [Exophiala xenobiotica]|nr:hypothetical protein H2202_011208 [Exophiala xenobiotica]KAK5188356.1 hypothetical protein LTR92_011577 [Exophiala xenobiotica]KAK5310392.1 hypothetical protein LTR93_012041 [Exophiala xenobiotica]KAK5431404.1 hypothetical protein LTR18_011395 [Exophiala xenobiotica]